jgi:hypothetical protein
MSSCVRRAAASGAKSAEAGATPPTTHVGSAAGSGSLTVTLRLCAGLLFLLLTSRKSGNDARMENNMNTPWTIEGNPKGSVMSHSAVMDNGAELYTRHGRAFMERVIAGHIARGKKYGMRSYVVKAVERRTEVANEEI